MENMGLDIYAFAEVRKHKKWLKVEDKIFLTYGDEKTDEPFSIRAYCLFGFLANVRNYACCPVISEPKSLPNNSEYLNSIDGKNWLLDGKYASYLTLKELLKFDYDRVFENQRVGSINFGRKMTVREHLAGTMFFNNLEVLKTLGIPRNVRVVFHFQ